MQVKDIFVSLVRIPSPSGEELATADWIASYLNNLGIETTGTREGNLTATISGSGPRIMLVAHMDTVQKPGEMISPQWDGRQFVSDGTTILGADDKAGVAAVLAAAEEIHQWQKLPNLILVFTVNEESGEMGAGKLKMNKLQPDLVLSVDGGKPVGTVDTKALGQAVFEVVITGRAAHAAVNPETGINAVAVMAKIICGIKQGRDSRGDAVNIGTVSGGGQTNVVADKASMRGEVRAFTTAGLNKLIERIRAIAEKQARVTGAGVKFTTVPEAGTPVWQENGSGKQWLKLLEKAAGRAGVKFTQSVMYACSDANPLSVYGAPTFVINRGGKNPHMLSESITLAEIEQTKSFIIEIVRLCQQ